jgi:hypothetical protein
MCIKLKDGAMSKAIYKEGKFVNGVGVFRTKEGFVYAGLFKDKQLHGPLYRKKCNSKVYKL